jgi:hypothetical protein
MEITIKELPPLKAFTENLTKHAPINGTPKKLFMLQCCDSPLLPKAASMGWEISGIGSDKEWLNSFANFAEKNRFSYGDLIHGDVSGFDISTIARKYDLLLSSGQLLHLSPQKFGEWLTILENGALVYSIIPNCQSVNASILKRISPDEWLKMISYSTETFDKMHTDFGLKIIRKANYSRSLNIHMLIPWPKIKIKINNILIYKILKISISFMAECSSPFVKVGNRRLNSIISGIYQK